MYEFFMSILGSLIVYFITRKYDLEVYAKSLIFLPRKKIIEYRWASGRDVIERSASDFLVLDLKLSLFYIFLMHVAVLTLTWVTYIFFGPPGTEAFPAEQQKALSGILAIAYSFAFPFCIIAMVQKYQLVRGHYLYKLKQGLRNKNYSARLLNKTELLKKHK